MNLRQKIVWLANTAAVVIAVFLFADAFGVLPRIGGSAFTGNGYGLVYFDKKASSPGYTLVAPLRGDTVYLLDWHGKVFKSWRIPGIPDENAVLENPGKISEGVLQARFFPNGHIIVGHGLPEHGVSQGSMGALVELDWNGKEVWSYENTMMHHDFARLPDGRTAVIVAEEVPYDIANAVLSHQSGTPSAASRKPVMFSDAVLEVASDGKVVWRWALWEHLDPNRAENFLRPGWSPYQWTALNSIEYLESNPITKKPAYLLGIHRFGTMVLVERESGKIIWRSERGVVASPHSVTMTRDGNFLAFDNGEDPAGKTDFGVVDILSSSIDEVKPAVVNGSYFASVKTTLFRPETLLSVKPAFFTPINGSVQELPNGNILVSAGLTGRIFEVEHETKRVVWDFISPFGFRYPNWPSNFMNNGVYSAHRYPSGYAQQLK